MLRLAAAIVLSSLLAGCVAATGPDDAPRHFGGLYGGITGGAATGR